MGRITHYALLIGINAYKEKPLEGAVRDVQDIKAYLEQAISDIHIHILTATTSTNPEVSGPVEDPQLLPTYDNVNSAFTKIIGLAKPGDFVYIHFSGHGTRREPDETSYNQHGDLALVLLGEEQDSKKCLSGRSLACYLNEMLGKSLVVTLVLDCCFSGSVHRDDSSIRFLPYNKEMDYVSPGEPGCKFETYAVDSENRDVSFVSPTGWFMNPDDYAILAACGPADLAQEIKMTNYDGQVHGALSYLLLRILKTDCNLSSIHKHIHDRLCGEFGEHQPSQHPVLYGNQRQGFFGLANPEAFRATILVRKGSDKGLELQAGQAHGISQGDRFALYRSIAVKDGSQTVPLVAVVSLTRAFTSDLDLERSVELPAAGETSWRARILIQNSLQRFPIELAPNLTGLDDWRAALKERSLTPCTSTEGDASALKVTLNSNQEYDIQGGSGQRVANLPMMRQNQISINQISDILEHLVRFRLATEIGKEVSVGMFQQSYDVHLQIKKDIFRSESSIEMKDDDHPAQLVVENRGAKKLCVFVYDLGPCWQVENVFRESYSVVMPQQTYRKRLKMRIPDILKEKGCLSCNDVIKVLITSKPTSFDILELPRISEMGKAGKASSADRTSQNFDELENWAVVNFPIHISL